MYLMMKMKLLLLEKQTQKSVRKKTFKKFKLLLLLLCYLRLWMNEIRENQVHKQQEYNDDNESKNCNWYKLYYPFLV